MSSLGLEWNNLGLCSEGMTQFCNALANNHGLEALDLRNNQLDEECAVLLTGALRKNTSLRALGNSSKLELTVSKTPFVEFLLEQ